MLINALRMGNVSYALYILLSTMIALSFHEFAHGYIASKCGDGTARAFGRLTLNPLAHLDVLGFISMMLAGFGWAKPVPVNMRNMRKPRRDIALVSLAGPMMNFLLAFGGVLLMNIVILITNAAFDGVRVDPYSMSIFFTESMSFGVNICWQAINFFYIFSIWNIGLGLWNLVPIPPLDGSKILSSLLPQRIGIRYMMLERYASIFMLVMIVISQSRAFDFLFYPLSIARETIFDAFNRVIRLIPVF